MADIELMAEELEQHLQSARIRDRSWIRAQIKSRDAEILKLKGELAVARERYGPAGYKIIAEVAELRGELERIQKDETRKILLRDCTRLSRDNQFLHAEKEQLRMELAESKATIGKAIFLNLQLNEVLEKARETNVCSPTHGDGADHD